METIKLLTAEMRWTWLPVASGPIPDRNAPTSSSVGRAIARHRAWALKQRRVFHSLGPQSGGWEAKATYAGSARVASERGGIPYLQVS
jgi:hypothetical protein